jgi:hypothetical protein
MDAGAGRKACRGYGLRSLGCATFMTGQVLYVDGGFIVG